MPHAQGEVLEIWLEGGAVAAWIACPANLRPQPGQYLLAHAPGLPGGPVGALPVPLFPGFGSMPPETTRPLPLAIAPPFPPDWLPGLRLELRGPLGSGFRLPSGTGAVRRLALAALGDTPARLMALAAQALAQEAAVTLFTDLPLPSGLSPAVEVYPTAALPESLPWADLLAIDLPLECLPGLRARFGGDPPGSAHPHLPVPAQVLVTTPMPCAGVAECGVCAVRKASRGWALACKDGPVFDLNDLEW